MPPGVVVFVVGAVFLLIAIVGGGFEVREIKLPMVPGKARAAAVAACLVCWVLGLWLLVSPPDDNSRDAASEPGPAGLSPMTPIPTPTSSPGSPPLDRAPLAALFPQGAESGGRAFFFINNGGLLQDSYSVQATCHRLSRSVGLQLKWNMSAAGEPSGGWGVQWDDSATGSFNASQFTSLTLSIRGTQGGETFQVGLRDRSGREEKVESKDRMVTTGQDWSQLEIRLADFSGVDSADVTNVNIGFNGDHGAGRICVDEIAFTAD